MASVPLGAAPRACGHWGHPAARQGGRAGRWGRAAGLRLALTSPAAPCPGQRRAEPCRLQPAGAERALVFAYFSLAAEEIDQVSRFARHARPSFVNCFPLEFVSF